MTPEQRAEEFIRWAKEKAYARPDVGDGREGDFGTWKDWQDGIELLIRAAVAEECEACAKLAEHEPDTDGGFDSAAKVLCDSIAAAIRARGQ